MGKLTQQLHDQGLLYTSPTKLPPAPSFWKHTAECAASATADGDEATLYSKRLLKHSLAAPPGAYKLLSEDYAFLDHVTPGAGRKVPPAAAAAGQAGAATVHMEADLPAPPLSLQQTRYMARARTSLVKLQTQVRQCVETVLSQAAGLMQSDWEVATLTAASPQPGALSPTGASNTQPPSLLAHLRSPPLVPNSTHQQSSSLTVSSTDKQQLVAHSTSGGLRPNKPAQGAQQAALGEADLSFDGVCGTARLKLAAMFDDCLDDMMEQLWLALQHAGGAHARADQMHHAMLHRDDEVVQAAFKHAAQLSKDLTAAQATIQQVQAEALSERIRSQAAVVAVTAHAERLSDAQQQLRELADQRDKARVEIESLRSAHAAAMQALQQEQQVALNLQASRIDELQLQLGNLHDVVRDRDGQLAAAHTRLGEQVELLELAFMRRDSEIKRAETLEKTLAELSSLVSSVCHLPGKEWLDKAAAAAPPGSLQPGELVDGAYGWSKALLINARAEGFSKAIALIKATLPEQLPRYEPPAAIEDVTTPSSPVPRMARLREEYVADLLPPMWVRLLAAPLAEQMSLPALCKHIYELYAAKDSADSASLASGTAAPSLHDVIARTYLARCNDTGSAEQQLVCFMQSTRAFCNTSPRVQTFAQFLGLMEPGLPDAALRVYLQYFRALRAPGASPAGFIGSNFPATTAPGGKAPAELFVESCNGAAAWVHPTRWKAVMAGPLSRHADGNTLRITLKAAGQLKVQSARSQPSFGMSDLDEVLSCVMTSWVTFTQTTAAEQLGELFNKHNVAGDGVFTKEAFTTLLGAVMPGSSPDAILSLEVLFTAMQEVGSTLQEKRVARGALTPEAFLKACVRCGVIGGLPQAASTLEVDRLMQVVSALQGVQQAMQPLLNSTLHQSAATTQLHGQMTTIQNKLQLQAPTGPSADTKKNEADVISAESVTACWAQVPSVGKLLAQVQSEAIQALEMRRKMVAEQVAEREAGLREELAAAQAAQQEAQQHLQEVMKQGSRPQSPDVRAAAHPSPRRSTTSPRLGPARRSSGILSPAQGANQANRAMTRSRSMPYHSGDGRLPSDALDGVMHEESRDLVSMNLDLNPNLHAELGEGVTDGLAVVQLKSDLAKATKRAEAAEQQYVSLRAQAAEQAAALEKVQGKAAKQRAAAVSRAAKELVEELSRLLQVWWQQQTGEVAAETDSFGEHLQQLLGLAGQFQGLSQSLLLVPSSTIEQPVAVAAGKQGGLAAGAALSDVATSDNVGAVQAGGIRFSDTASPDGAGSPRGRLSPGKSKSTPRSLGWAIIDEFDEPTPATAAAVRTSAGGASQAASAGGHKPVKAGKSQSSKQLKQPSLARVSQPAAQTREEGAEKAQDLQDIVAAAVTAVQQRAGTGSLEGSYLEGLAQGLLAVQTPYAQGTSTADTRTSSGGQMGPAAGPNLGAAEHKPGSRTAALKRSTSVKSPLGSSSDLSCTPGRSTTQPETAAGFVWTNSPWPSLSAASQLSSTVTTAGRSPLGSFSGAEPTNEQQAGAQQASAEVAAGLPVQKMLASWMLQASSAGLQAAGLLQKLHAALNKDLTEHLQDALTLQGQGGQNPSSPCMQSLDPEQQLREAMGLQPAATLGAYLGQCFLLSEHDLYQLGHGVLALMKASGGQLPLVGMDGSIRDSQGELLVLPRHTDNQQTVECGATTADAESSIAAVEPTSVPLPEAHVQAERLGQLYAANAALLASQYAHAARLGSVQQHLSAQLTVMHSAAAAAVQLQPHTATLQGLSGLHQFVQQLSQALTAIHEHAFSCSMHSQQVVSGLAQAKQRTTPPSSPGAHKLQQRGSFSGAGVGYPRLSKALDAPTLQRRGSFSGAMLPTMRHLRSNPDSPQALQRRGSFCGATASIQQPSETESTSVLLEGAISKSTWSQLRADQELSTTLQRRGSFSGAVSPSWQSNSQLGSPAALQRRGSFSGTAVQARADASLSSQLIPDADPLNSPEPIPAVNNAALSAGNAVASVSRLQQRSGPGTDVPLRVDMHTAAAQCIEDAAALQTCLKQAGMLVASILSMLSPPGTAADTQVDDDAPAAFRKPLTPNSSAFNPDASDNLASATTASPLAPTDGSPAAPVASAEGDQARGTAGLSVHAPAPLMQLTGDAVVCAITALAQLSSLLPVLPAGKGLPDSEHQNNGAAGPQAVLLNVLPQQLFEWAQQHKACQVDGLEPGSRDSVSYCAASSQPSSSCLQPTKSSLPQDAQQQQHVNGSCAVPSLDRLNRPVYDSQHQHLQQLSARSGSQQHMAGGGACVLWEYPVPITPPGSPRQSMYGHQLPPGEPLITIDPSLMRRSQLSPPRYRRTLQHPLSAASHHAPTLSTAHLAPLPEGALSRPYASRPYTARRHVEDVLCRSAQRDPYSSRHQVCDAESGAFWIPAVVRPQSSSATAAEHPSSPSSRWTSPQRLKAGTGLLGPWPWWHQALRNNGPPGECAQDWLTQQQQQREPDLHHEEQHQQVQQQHVQFQHHQQRWQRQHRHHLVPLSLDDRDGYAEGPTELMVAGREHTAGQQQQQGRRKQSRVKQCQLDVGTSSDAAGISHTVTEQVRGLRASGSDGAASSQPSQAACTQTSADSTLVPATASVSATSPRTSQPASSRLVATKPRGVAADGISSWHESSPSAPIQQHSGATASQPPARGTKAPILPDVGSARARLNSLGQVVVLDKQ